MSKKRDRLESKVMKFKLPHDENGTYIPFCVFEHHKGIVLREYVCEQRDCKYFQKLYIGSTSIEGLKDGCENGHKNRNWNA